MGGGGQPTQPQLAAAWNTPIARGGECLLDRIDKAADRGFRVVPWEHVLRFVEWDLNHNTLFEYNGWVLNQNIKGSR